MLADALKELKGRSVSEAVGFFKRHAAADVRPGTVPEILEELLKEKKADGVGDYHSRDLEIRLGRLRRAFLERSSP